jgi:hypothetical protein
MAEATVSRAQQLVSKGSANFNDRHYYAAWVHLTTAIELSDDHTLIPGLRALANEAYKRSLPNRREKKRRKEREERDRRKEVERRARNRDGQHLRSTGSPPISRQSLAVYLCAGLLRDSERDRDQLSLPPAP